jgi:PBSX family phage terminase large subunit
MTMKRVELYPKQDDFFHCPDRFTGFVGGIGSGKSFVGALKGIYSGRTPGSVGLVVAPTYPMLRDATLHSYRDLLGDGFGQFNKSEMILIIPGGGMILFRSADNPDRLRGPNIDWAHIDEASLCPRETWDIVIGRLRGHGGAGPCWVTTTPKGRNWLYERQAEMTIFKAATKDNPYLSPEFVTSLERSYTGTFARQELYGEFVAFEGLIYNMFSRDVHIRPASPEQYPARWLGNDEGYTNPSVILDAGTDSDGRVHIFREWYRRGQLQDAVVDANKKWHDEIHPRGDVVDSSAAGLIAALRAIGLPAMPHKGRVLDGIGKVQNMLAVAGDGRPRLTIDPSCVQTIAEFESYCWKEGRDEPEKQNDHAMDTIRYIIDMIGIRTITALPDPFD